MKIVFKLLLQSAYSRLPHDWRAKEETVNYSPRKNIRTVNEVACEQVKEVCP